MENIYSDGRYLELHPEWHDEDARWKAAQIARMLSRHNLKPASVLDVGCGAGGVISALADFLPDARMSGFDISPQAIEIAAKRTTRRITYQCGDAFQGSDRFDLLLAIDVFEHVPDYIGFIARCKPKSDYKIFHIPLDMHVCGLLLDGHMRAREKLGHLHYFNASSAIATLRDAGHEVIDQFYTCSSLDEIRNYREAVAFLPRLLLAKISKKIAALVLGGFSLMVLTH